MRRYFLSDVHLYPEPMVHPGRKTFISFLQKLHDEEEPGELWIVGDLFDFWFEYSAAVPAGYSDCICALRSLTGKNWNVHFLPGNHDYWVGRRFSVATGAVIHGPAPVKLDTGRRKVLIHHGDGLGSGDLGYRIMKPVLRSAAARWLFSMVHPTLGSRFALLFSSTSKRVLRRDLDRIPQGLMEWVEAQLEEDADIVITGHTHLDTVIRSEKGVYVSLGDWLTRYTYCLLNDDADPQLISFSEQNADGGMNR